MSISAQQIKELRDKTGAGISDVKKALEDAKGNLEAAFKLLERKLGSASLKRASRETKAGLIGSYVHSNGRIAALVEVFCETDFVARNPGFNELAHDLAMHVTAMKPIFMSVKDVPPEEWQTEKARFMEEAKKMNKPPEMLENIVDGKLKAYFEPLSFLEQTFVKGQDKKVLEVVNEASGRFGENIKVNKFVRLEI